MRMKVRDLKTHKEQGSAEGKCSRKYKYLQTQNPKKNPKPNISC